MCFTASFFLFFVVFFKTNYFLQKRSCGVRSQRFVFFFNASFHYFQFGGCRILFDALYSSVT